MGDFGALNTTVLVIYLAGVLAIGIALAGRQRDTQDYFLAGRRIPWLAVGMSMFASLTSATTVMGVPGFAYGENVAMIFGAGMSLAAAALLARLFYPIYRRLHVTTSYEYIYHRYGSGARYSVSLLFVASRLAWLGIVIYAPAKAMTVASGIPLVWTILTMGVLAVAYTVLGGLAAVIWTDVLQFVVLLGGMVWLVVSLVAQVPEGVSGILETAAAADKLAVFNWRDFGQLTALSAMVGWFFVFLHEYGTDQITVQRLLAVRQERGVIKAITFNATNDLLINGLLIFIGIGIFAYYQAYPAYLDPAVGPDGVLSAYIMHSLPPGISGLMVTAIFAAAMSSVDSGINSLSTVIVNDVIKPMYRSPLSERQALRLARTLTLVLGVVATAAALRASSIEGIVKMWMNIMGFFAAPILSLFLLGVLTKRANFWGWLVGLIGGIAFTLFLKRHFGDRLMPIWLTPCSLAVCTLVGYASSLLMPAGASVDADR